LNHNNRKLEAIKLRKRGHSIGGISQKLNISKSTLSDWFRKIKLTSEQKQNVINTVHEININFKNFIDQVLVLDKFPLERLEIEHGKCTNVINVDGIDQYWLTELDRFCTEFIKEENAKANEINMQNKLAYINKKNKNIIKVEPSYSNFAFANLHKSYNGDPLKIISILDYYFRNKASATEIYYILQKNIYIITNTTTNAWYKAGFYEKVEYIYADINVMGIGVHIPSLTEVRLPRSNPNQIYTAIELRQAMGRVGRPEQSLGKIIASSLEQYNTVFSEHFEDSFNQSFNHLFTGCLI